MSGRRGSRAAVALGATACLLAAGCLIPYAYPKLSYVPGCEFGPEANEIHAFRVDVSEDHLFFGGDTGQYTITEISPRSDGSVPPQSRVTVERGFGLLLQLGRKHATCVRLYRPGYKLVELDSWDSTDKISWQPAENWGDQAWAINKLLARPILFSSFWALHGSRDHLPDPPTSPGATRAVVFIAAECERVAALAPTPETAARLRERARQLVENKPPATQPNSTLAPRLTRGSP